MRSARSLGREDRGDAGGHALELLVIAPVMLLFVLLLVAFGRTASASSKVDAAAASAARAASQKYDAVSARQAATAQAEKAISDAGVACGELTVDVDTSGFAVATGQPGSVVIEVHCTVDLSDVAAPGVPGSVHLSGRAASPIDLFREGTDRR